MSTSTTNNNNTPKPPPEPERLDEFISLLNPHNPPEAILDGTTGIRRLLSQADTAEMRKMVNLMIKNGGGGGGGDVFVARLRKSRPEPRKNDDNDESNNDVISNLLNLIVPPEDSPLHTDHKTVNSELYKKVVVESLWALSNLASESSEVCTLLVGKFCSQTLSILQTVLEAGDANQHHASTAKTTPEMVDCAVFLLGNLVGDSTRARDIILDYNGSCFPKCLMQSLAALTKVTPPFVAGIRNIAWTMCNFARGKPVPNLEKVSPLMEVVPPLLLQFPDDDVKLDILWFLSYVSENPGDRAAATRDPMKSGAGLLVMSGVLQPLFTMAGKDFASLPSSQGDQSPNARTSKPPSLLVPFIRIIGNFLSQEDPQLSDIPIQAGIMPLLVQLLHHPGKNIQKEVAWSLSNIAAGTKEQAQYLIQMNALPPVIHLLQTAEHEVKKECMWVIANLLSADKDSPRAEITQMIINCGFINCLVPILSSSTDDNLLTTVGLESLQLILNNSQRGYDGMKNKPAGQEKKNPVVDMVEQAGALDILEKLQEHQNHNIYALAVDILENHFVEVEEKEDEEVSAAAPPAPEGARSDTFAVNAGSGADGGFSF